MANHPITSPSSDEQQQLDRFKDAARQLGADDDEAKFNDRLKKIATAKTKEEPKK